MRCNVLQLEPFIGFLMHVYPPCDVAWVVVISVKLDSKPDQYFKISSRLLLADVAVPKPNGLSETALSRLTV